MQLAQLLHAAGESAALWASSLAGGPRRLPYDTHAIALHARSEAELLQLEQRLQVAKIPHVSVREVDAPFEGQLMAIGLCPSAGKEVRRLLSSLPLAR